MEKNLRNSEVCSVINFIEDLLNCLRNNKGLDEYINLKPQYEILKKEEQDIFENISEFESGIIDRDEVISNLLIIKIQLLDFKESY